MIVIPPGKGKSRVVCAIATIFKKVLSCSTGRRKKSDKRAVKRIYICFSSEILMDTDQEVYDILNDLLSDIEIVMTVGTKDIEATPEDLIILDEGDWHLFDDICQGEEPLPKCKGIIALTATSISNCDGKEEKYLKDANFKVIESGMTQNIDVK